MDNNRDDYIGTKQWASADIGTPPPQSTATEKVKISSRPEARTVTEQHTHAHSHPQYITYTRASYPQPDSGRELQDAFHDPYMKTYDLHITISRYKPFSLSNLEIVMSTESFIAFSNIRCQQVYQAL